MSVAISVDGADAKTHDSFRGINGAFEQTFRGIEACRGASLPFQFNMVIRKETLSQLEDMLRLAVDSGADAAEFFDLIAAGRAKQECKSQVLTNDERKWAMEWLAQAQACILSPCNENRFSPGISRQTCCAGFLIMTEVVPPVCRWVT